MRSSDKDKDWVNFCLFLDNLCLSLNINKKISSISKNSRLPRLLKSSYKHKESQGNE